MRRETFAQASLDAAAAALNRVFEQYVVPVAFAPEQLRLHMLYNDVDASASPLWYDDEGNLMAAALLALRGVRAWIGGFGVAPDFRGRGYAKALVSTLADWARERGAKQMQLEVLAQNDPAIEVYRGAGFETTRTLHSFQRSIAEPRMPRGFAPSEVGGWLDAHEIGEPCWQRERRTLRNGAVTASVSDTDGNYALFRSNAQTAQVLELHAANPAALDWLALAVSAYGECAGVLILNEPEDSRISAYARTARWSEPFVQYEMILRLK